MTFSEPTPGEIRRDLAIFLGAMETLVHARRTGEPVDEAARIRIEALADLAAGALKLPEVEPHLGAVHDMTDAEAVAAGAAVKDYCGAVAASIGRGLPPTPTNPGQGGQQP